MKNATRASIMDNLLISPWQTVFKLGRQGVVGVFYLLIGCVPIAQQGSNNPSVGSGAPTPDASATAYADEKLRTFDYIYEENIKTVLLYPQVNDLPNPSAATLQPAVLPIEQGNPLILEFDELGEQTLNYHAKVYHCNADWTISLLSDIQFLSEYNDYNITNYQLSANTKVPYTHYRMEVPKVKLPGNYLLMVHREGNVKDLVLTRRFMVYDNTVDMMAAVIPASGVQERQTNHQIEFAINYRNYQITNPRDEVKVVLRQNYRWDNAITTLKPQNVHLNESRLEYNQFDLENNFKAGNEFRFFDMRSIRFLGMHMAKINRAPDQNQVLLNIDQPRSGEAYARVDDFNGGFVVDNYETRLGATEADYVHTFFTLKMPEVKGEVYVNGKLNDWLLNEKNRMIYSPEAQEYKARILLKQGIYNYNYAVSKPGSDKRDETLLEGSFFNTENTYEVIAYFRPIGSRADLIIGYKVLYHNARR
jgi:hypothetical protein